MTITEATDAATNGTTCEQIAKRVRAYAATGERSALLEIALLALAEAARVTEDETALQDAIDEASEAVAGAVALDRSDPR